MSLASTALANIFGVLLYKSNPSLACGVFLFFRLLATAAAAAAAAAAILSSYFCAVVALVRFVISIVGGYDVLVNDDKTRSFVCLRVRGGRQLILQLIAKVDPLMRRFKQPEYYEVLLFHIPNEPLGC